MHSPDALKREVEAGHALSYAQGHGLDSLMARVLRFGNAYHTNNVFVSDGPIIHGWPDQGRTMVLAAEPFVASQEVTVAPAYVTAEQGLREVRVYDGDRLVRRFELDGQTTFRQTMHFARPVQQNLILVAEDTAGGRAVSYYFRLYKDGSMGFRFCGDRINDCGSGMLGKGPGMFPTVRVPEIDGGVTWDGGPRGRAIVFQWANNHPQLTSDLGSEPYGTEPHGGLFNNLPLLEMTDDQVAVVRSELREVYDPQIPVINSWRTWGPIHPAKLIHSTRRYVEYNRPAVHVAPMGHAFIPERRGARVASFQNTVTFQQDQQVAELRLLRTHRFRQNPLLLVVGNEHGGRVVELRRRSQGFEFSLERGGWFGFYTPAPSNGQLLINRGETVRVKISPAGREQHMAIYADLDDARVSQGESLTYEIFSVAEPLDQEWRDPARFLRVVDYLHEPAGLYVHRGRRVDDPGFVTLEPEHGAAELEVSQLEARLSITLPVRVGEMNPHWSTGMFQINGYSTGFYGDAQNVYTPVGVDDEGYAYAALYPDMGHWRVAVGHPVVCDESELIIEAIPVEHTRDGYRWHVAVNNPTNQAITATFRSGMDAPGLDFDEQTHTISAGQYLVLVHP